MLVKMLNKKKISKKVIKCILYAIGILVLVFVYQCPFKRITGLDCPGCGLTRAFICALKLDFGQAFSFQPFWPLLGIETLYVILHDIYPQKLSINKKIELIFGLVSWFLLLTVWIIRRLK